MRGIAVKIMKKKHLKICLCCFGLILFLAVLAFSVSVFYAPKGATRVFTIEQGATGRVVARKLKDAGFINSETFFLLVLRLTSGAGGLKAGNFNLSESMTSVGIISCISSGKCQVMKRVTVLEGMRVEEVAELLAQNNITPALDFMRRALEQNMEGYLYPSTYKFIEGTPPQRVIDVMKAEFDKNIRPILPKGDYWLTENQILTLASIVEREALLDHEYPRVAAVYINRFKIGMRLQADPTVQYALGYSEGEGRFWRKKLTLADLRKTDSPYNTYMYATLPPGPICSPSLRSVRAVLNPAPNFDALFFVADTVTGGHIFTETYDHHIRAIRAIRKKK